MNIVFIGNCQAHILKNMLDEQDDAPKISVFELWKMDLSEVGHYERVVRSADLIWCQPVQRDYRGDDRLSTDWLKKNASTSCKIVVFPVVFWLSSLYV